MERIEQGQIHHLNHTVEIGVQNPDWFLGKVSANRLWVITLHYHQWLYELAVLIHHGRRLFQQDQAVGVGVLRIGVGKV